ncbi:beta-N-acetylhexosaminidase [Xylanivirga thermophila]|uniref:beta-N-acetylhexosaminidase n=1 Tax=Xylanivirga thermophila TaxID=2496273 RepID=UPI00101DF052|nr:beta-N-acetylhexosaminidase [Xylanivirga thermophila]
MKFNFEGNLAELKKGIDIFAKEFNFEIGDNGFPVEVVKTAENKLGASFQDGKGKIFYRDKIHFFRALGLFLEGMEGAEPFEITEEPQFHLVGPMLDVSRNAVLTVDSIKKYINKLAVMGLNSMMLYTEDTYAVEGYPYFGYMRGRYTYEELKACDDYADIFGIEIIPCIQTLAHLTQALKWDYAEDIRDTADILLVGDEKTYKFIEDMITAASAPFRSKRIHIGMDEAHNLGLGKYLDNNGYRRRFDIMNGHLSKVVEIANRHGLKPMIWSDMYFRLGSKAGEYYDVNAKIPEDVIQSVPNEVQLVFWDYYHLNEEDYSTYLKMHKKFHNDILFAGGLWTWNGIMPHHDMMLVSTNAALNACKKEGINEVIATMWGDNGAETNLFTGLLGLQLYAEHAYNKKVDMNRLKDRFHFTTGIHYESFDELKAFDVIPGVSDTQLVNPSKYLLWQDILMGLFDKHVEKIEGLDKYYDTIAERMDCYRNAYGEWNFLFDMPYHLAKVLAIKAHLGCDIKTLYDENDKEELRHIAEEVLPELYKRVDNLRISHRDQWMTTNKPFGWEVLDIRYGGVLARIDTAKSRILDYVEGTIENIPELEEKRLFFDGRQEAGDKKLVHCNQYTRISTASPL